MTNVRNGLSAPIRKVDGDPSLATHKLRTSTDYDYEVLKTFPVLQKLK